MTRDQRTGTSRRWRVGVWDDGFVVEANDDEHAIVAAIAAITADGYLLRVEPVEEGEGNA